MINNIFRNLEIVRCVIHQQIPLFSHIPNITDIQPQLIILNKIKFPIPNQIKQ